MSFLGDFVSRTFGKVWADIEAVIEGLVGLVAFYALTVERPGDGDQKKAEVTEAIIKEIEEPGGLDLPRWMKPETARAILRWLIDKVIEAMKARGFLQGSAV